MDHTSAESDEFVPSASSVLLFIALGPALTTFLWYVWCYLNSPLRKQPGPFLAGWTNLWRLYHVWRGESHIVVHKLHQTYGPVVRIGPNVLDIDLPDLVKTIYNTKGNWKKTEFYHGSSAKVDGKIIYNLFSETDSAKHARERKPVSRFYSMNGVLPLEPHMNEVIKHFCSRLEEEFLNGPNAGKTCNLGDWLLFYAWDLVGKSTFSQAFGYLDKGYDFDGTLWASERAIDYFAVVGQIPILDYFFDKNPVCRVGPPGFGTVTGISVQHLIDRYQGNDKNYHNPEVPDFLDKFIEAKKMNPDIVDDKQIVSWLLTNMIAGADTTAITIRAAFYYSLKNPRVWNRLETEILASGVAHNLPASFKDAHNIPYLEAVVRESMRLHPGVAMCLERYVPETGLRLPDGSFLPPGAIVGMNPYIISRNKDVFGCDVETFRPERWLRDVEHGETDDAFRERLGRMNTADLSFGAGSRICIGKNLGLLEVYKVVATLVAQYRIELADPDKEWKVVNSWFTRQEGLEVKVSRRNTKMV